MVHSFTVKDKQRDLTYSIERTEAEAVQCCWEIEWLVCVSRMLASIPALQRVK